MTNVTVTSLKKENDSLKVEIAAIKRNLEERQDPQVTSNGANNLLV